MKNNIKVKCIKGFKQFRNNKEKTLLSQVEEGKVYEATLYELTDEYFAKDSEGREFLVGEMNIDDNLVLQPEFELIG
jgi:hypothetical protein